jgi:hypothetical protein
MGTMTRELIGRDHPAGILRAEINRAMSSHGGLVLVTGEAGIGKTTLVTAAAEDAQRSGALVLSGSCWDSESAPGYWPWVQVIRGLRRSATPEERAAAENAAGGGLSILLGESHNAEAIDDFRLYDAVTTALVSLSHSRPVVVVLDDLHWADTASLKLLEFAAQHTWFERLLLIGTYRDVEVEATDHPLRPLMMPLLSKATTVTLTGLDEDQVAALMANTVGRAPEGELAAEVHRRTGGNPFFVEQTARLWHSGGSVTAIAPGVREALRRRLELLPKPVERLLATAAVLGREFHRQVLAAVASAPVPHVDRLLDEAIATRLVIALGGGRFAFAHDLVRETLYESLDEKERRRQHALVITSLDQSPALRERVLPADLARHAHLADGELEASRAVDHLLAAARDAGGRLSTDEAISHYRRAYQLADELPRRRIVIGLDLIGALRHGNHSDEASRIYPDVIALVRELGDNQIMARVALSLYAAEDLPDQERLRSGLLEEAYTRLVGPQQDQLSTERMARELTVRATVLARSGADDDALGFSLWAQHNAIWGPGSAGERAALTKELMEVARRTGDGEMEFFAASFRWVALLEAGDPRYLDQVTEFVAITDRQGMPLSRMASSIDQAIIATLHGRFADAESFMDSLADTVDDHPHQHMMYMLLHLRWALVLLRGHHERLDELHRALAEADHPHIRLLIAISALETGKVSVAHRYARESIARGDPVSRFVKPLWVRFLAQIAAATRDPELCARARAELAPFAGEWSVSMYGCDISGPFALWSALLDAAEQRWDEAIAGFTEAYRSADALRARPWSVAARTHLALALLARGDADAGAALAKEVRWEAEELGMRHIATRLRADSVPDNEFRRVGEVWELTMAGHTVHLPDAKGLRDLHTLISLPGKDIPVVELLNPEGGELVVAARRMGGDAVLDDEAKASYRRRLAELDEEIDRAVDDRQAVRLDKEREALLDELRSAAGLAGRSRKLGDESERARKTVTARIRDTLRKLDAAHPELAEHLRASISTGLTCRYQPEHKITWRL